MTTVPWSEGKCLVWDFTCSDTLAHSHLNKAVQGAGIVATDAESRKKAKYSSLPTTYIFVPIAIETFGAMGTEATYFFNELGRRMADTTEEPRSKLFLLQRISVALQRGNGACVLGTIPASNTFNDIYYL